jgi:hypothetical protein
MAACISHQAMVVRRLLAIAQRMSGWSSGWAARVIATVVGNIGGFRLLTGLIGRGAGDLAGEAFDILIEVLEDI